MKHIVIIFLGVILISGCYGGWYYWRERLDIDRTDQKENLQELSLPLGGVWIDESKGNMMALYSNGVVLRSGGFLMDETQLLEDQLLESRPYWCNVPYWWGLYEIEGDKINIEKWTSSSGLDKYGKVKIQCQVLDSENITAKMVTRDGVYNFHYRFYPTENKPDSCMRWFRD